jgi:hypothetical protein
LAWFRRHPVSEADLSAFVDGALSPPARAAKVRAHVEGCDSCRARVEDLLQLRTMVRALPRPEAPRSFAVRPGLVGSEKRRAPAQGGPRYALAPAAALTALLLLLGADFVAFPDSNGGSRPAAAPSLAKSTGAAAESGGRPEAALSDRSANALPSAVPPSPAANNFRPQATAAPPAAAGVAPVPQTGAVAAEPQTAPVAPAPGAGIAPTPSEAPAAGGPADAARQLQPQFAPTAPPFPIPATAVLPLKPPEPQSSSSTARPVLRVLEAVAALVLAVSLVFFAWKSRSITS